MSAAKNPLTKKPSRSSWNFKLLSQHELGGFGGMGEGMAIQIAKDGRRIIWLAHESAPKNFTGVDVTDPRNPKVVVQTELPHMLHALELARSVRRHHGGRLSDAEDRHEAGRLRAVRHLGAGEAAARFRSSTARARIRAACINCGSATANTSTWRPARPTSSRAIRIDDQFYRCIDVRNPSKPVEVGRWWMPGTRVGDNVAPPPRHRARHGLSRAQHQRLSAAAGPLLSRLHRRRHVRAWTSPTRRNPKVDLALEQLAALHRLHAHRAAAVRPRPVAGHRRVDRGQCARLAEADLDAGRARRDSTSVPISTCPLPPVDAFKDRGGRFGAHNIHENVPVPSSFQSDQIIFGTFFNGGLRAYDISNPYQPKEIAAFVPPAPNGSQGRRDPAQRCVCRRERRSSIRSTGFPAGCIFWSAISRSDARVNTVRHPRRGDDTSDILRV